MVLWPFFASTERSAARAEAKRRRRRRSRCAWKLHLRSDPPLMLFPLPSYGFVFFFPSSFWWWKIDTHTVGRWRNEEEKGLTNSRLSLSFFYTYNRFYSLFSFGILFFNSSRSCPSVSQSGADVPLCQTEDCSVSSSCHQPFFVISKEKNQNRKWRLHQKKKKKKSGIGHGKKNSKFHRSWRKNKRAIPYQQLIVIEPGSLLYPHLMKLYTDTHYTQHKQPNDVYNPLFGCVWESFRIKYNRREKK